MRRAFEAVAAVLRGLAALRPTLLLLDDLHNAGLATVEFLHFLARHSGRSRLLVLATLRPEEGGDALAALADVANRWRWARCPPTRFTGWPTTPAGPNRPDILRRTGGHTLFVVATLQALLAGEPGVPESLQAVVLARIGRMGSAVEDVLRAGAVRRRRPGGGGRDAGRSAVRRRAAVRAGGPAPAGRAAASTSSPTTSSRRPLRHDAGAGPDRVPPGRRGPVDPPARGGARHAAAAADWPRAARVPAGRGAGAGALRGRRRRGAARAGPDAAEQAGEAELLCRSFLVRGRARQVLGAFRSALEDYRSGLVTARQAGDRRHEMLVLRELGGHALCGRRARWRVRRLAVAGLAIAQSLGDRATEAALLGRLRCCEQPAALRRGAGLAARGGRRPGSPLRRALAHGLDALKNAYAYLGELAAARGAVDELEPLLRRSGTWSLEWAVFEAAIPASPRRGRQGGAPDRRGRGDRPPRRGDRPRLVVPGPPGLGRPAAGTARRRCSTGGSRWRGAPVRRPGSARRRPRSSPAPCWRGDAAGPRPRSCARPRRRRCGGRGGVPAALPSAARRGHRGPGRARGADRLLGGSETQPGGAWLLGADVYVCVARARQQRAIRGGPRRARARCGRAAPECDPGAGHGGARRRPVGRHWATEAPSRPRAGPRTR